MIKLIFLLAISFACLTFCQINDTPSCTHVQGDLHFRTYYFHQTIIQREFASALFLQCDNFLANECVDAREELFSFLNDENDKINLFSITDPIATQAFTDNFQNKRGINELCHCMFTAIYTINEGYEDNETLQDQLIENTFTISSANILAIPFLLILLLQFI